MRLNIEERAFGDSRRKKLSHLTGIPENYILGPLPLLWHNSQEQDQAIGTKEEILDWCEEFDERKREALFNGLVLSRYIRQTDEDEFEIIGNETQLENIRKLKLRAQKGGKATKSKWAKKNKKPATPQAEPLAGLSTNQAKPEAVLTVGHEQNPAKPEAVLEVGQEISLATPEAMLKEDSSIACARPQALLKADNDISPPQPESCGELYEHPPNSSLDSNEIIETAYARPQALLKAQQNNSPATPQAMSVVGLKHCSMQGNAIQGNAIQYSKEKKSKKESSAPNPTPSPKLDATAPGSLSLSDYKIPKKWKDKISEFDIQMASTWLTFAKEQVPRGRFNEKEFQISITKMRHEYCIAEDEISSIFEWCKDSDFWRNKSYSPVGLLKRKGEKSNLDTILMQKAQQKRSSSSSPIFSEQDTAYKRKLLELDGPTDPIPEPPLPEPDDFEFDYSQPSNMDEIPF